GFSATDTSDAVNILYPITMTVQANKAWQASGLKKSFFLPSHKSKRKLTAVCSHQTRIGNLDAHLI
ncbi:hypothetical protein AADQ19_26270, partial [Escherichia coli]